jgi:hypothetical protein
VFKRSLYTHTTSLRLRKNAGFFPSPSHSHARISRTLFFATSRLHRGTSEYSSIGVSSSSCSCCFTTSSSLLVDAVDVVEVFARLNQPRWGGEGVREGDVWAFAGSVWIFLERSLESHEVFCENADEDEHVGEGKDGALETCVGTLIGGWAFIAFLGRSLESHEVFCDEAPEDVDVDEGVGEGEDEIWDVRLAMSIVLLPGLLIDFEI